MSDKFRNRYRIPTSRLPNWDYSDNGYYFITVCTKNKEDFFGKIIKNKIRLSVMGVIAKKYWLEISKHFPFVELDEFIVMPNHVHGIMIIKNINSNVETPNLGVSTTSNTKLNKWKSGCLGAIINQYKRICTIEIRKKYTNFFWQSRFYDHIIRHEKEYYRIKQYIRDNPKNWEQDKDNFEDLWEGNQLK